MIYTVIQPFKNSTGEVVSLGSEVDITEQQAAGMNHYVRPAATPDKARRLMMEISSRDPCGGCWEWMKTNRPELWRHHIKALHDDDITTARLLFNEMLAAWECRYELEQQNFKGFTE